MGESFGYTFCDACNQVPLCGVKATVRNGKIVSVESWEGYPNGPLCARGYATLQEHYHPKRLLHPMVRAGPKGSGKPAWRRVSWEEAYGIVASRLGEIRDKHGPESVMFLVGEPKEPRLAVSRLASAFGSPNYGTESSLCSRGSELAAQLLYGLAVTRGLPGPETRGMLLWARNPAWSGLYRMGRLLEAKRRGVKFVVVDVRRTPTVEVLADVHLQPRPGTDGALALGMLHLVVKKKLYDEEIAGRWSHGFEELAEYLEGFDPKTVERITWVPEPRIREAVEILAENRPWTLLAGDATLLHTTNGVQNMRAILSLLVLMGNLDVPGGLQVPTYPLLPFHHWGSPVRTPDEMLQLDFMLVGDKIRMRDKRVDLDFAPVWAELVPEQVQANFLPEYVERGLIKAAVMFGVNLAMWPQYEEYQKAVEKLEFAVAVDKFYRPWTHDYVDVLLPSATMYEREEPFAVFGRRVYARRRVVEPRGEAKPDWQIVFELAVKLGLGDWFWGGDTRKAMDWLLLKAAGARLSEVPIPEGREFPAPGPERYKKYELGLLRSDGKLGFPTPTGKIELWSTILEKHGFDPLPTYREPEESPISRPDLAEKYPLILITGSRSPVYTHSQQRELSWLRELEPLPAISINPGDARERGIDDGDWVVVETAHGKARLVARLTYMVPRGVVDMPHGWVSVPGSEANLVVPRSFDPISGYPYFKALLCEVRKQG